MSTVHLTFSPAEFAALTPENPGAGRGGPGRPGGPGAPADHWRAREALVHKPPRSQAHRLAPRRRAAGAVAVAVAVVGCWRLMDVAMG